MIEIVGVAGLVLAVVALVLDVGHRRRLLALEEARRADELVRSGRAEVIVELPPNRVRVRNVGHAPARDVTVRMPSTDRIHMRVDTPTEPLPVLMPGQHFDFVGVRTDRTPPTIAATVSWVDDTGTHEEVIPVSTLNDGMTAVG